MLEKCIFFTNVNGGGTDICLPRIAGGLISLILLMTFTVPALAADYRPTTGGEGNDISLTLSGPNIAAWKGMAMFTASASDNDYYSANNWVTSTPISDTLTYSWDFAGMGTPGQPNGSYTGVQNMVPGAYTVKSIVNDTAPSVYSPNTGSRDDEGPKIAQMDVAVVRTDINTGLEDTGYSGYPSVIIAHITKKWRNR